MKGRTKKGYQIKWQPFRVIWQYCQQRRVPWLATLSIATLTACLATMSTLAVQGGTGRDTDRYGGTVRRSIDQFYVNHI